MWVGTKIRLSLQWLEDLTLIPVQIYRYALFFKLGISFLI
jgi:hypothetical protein